MRLITEGSWDEWCAVFLPRARLQVSELWTRELQVLPGRTHPLMNMHGASGFVLSGIKTG
jgi:hypothetical protein